MFRRSTVYFASAALGLLIGSPPALAQSASAQLRLGYWAPRIQSELWDENLDTFAIGRSEFDAFVGGFELAIPLASKVDLSFGVASAARTVASNYRDFVRDDGTEIIQDLRLRDTPVTVGVRVLPLRKPDARRSRRGRARARADRGRRSQGGRGATPVVSPYVTAGFGLHFYEYREQGEFIDFDTFDIFVEEFIDRGVALGAFAGGGIEIAVSRRVFVTGEYRFHWARGDHGDDFEGFGSFDLRAHEVTGGLGVRF